MAHIWLLTGGNCDEKAQTLEVMSELKVPNSALVAPAFSGNKLKACAIKVGFKIPKQIAVAN